MWCPGRRCRRMPKPEPGDLLVVTVTETDPESVPKREWCKPEPGATTEVTVRGGPTLTRKRAALTEVFRRCRIPDRFYPACKRKMEDGTGATTMRRRRTSWRR